MNEAMKTVNDQFNSMFGSCCCCEDLVKQRIIDDHGGNTSDAEIERGMRDAKRGVKRKIGQPVDYDRGFTAMKNLVNKVSR